MDNHELKMTNILTIQWIVNMFKALLITCVAITLFFTGKLYAQTESGAIVIESFNGTNYDGWTAEGNAFGDHPLNSKDGMPGSLGEGVASSEGSTADATGTLTSPPFVIKRKSIHFLVGAAEIFFLPGSQQYGNLAVQLLIDNEVVRMTVPDQFHSMFWESWDVSGFKGMSARIKIIDEDKRDWAHIDADQFVQSDVPPGGALLKRRIKITKPVLNFPVEENGNRQFVELLVEGKPVRAMDIALAGEKIDYWAFTDVSKWLGKEMTVRTRQYFGSPNILDRLSVENGIIGSDNLYHESLRSQFHFSSKRGWLNDPNGLVYYDGEYHLFYQHNPFGCDFSRNDYSKSWGHAISTDLVHWTELPDAIYPDSLGSIYSGSSVVDENNTAGFRTGKEKPIIAIYTSAGNRDPWSKGKKFTQSIAYSNDRGRTFIKFKGNPVLGNMEYLNRDPYVFWYGSAKRWVLVLHFDGRAMAFFNSKDLKTWEFKSELPVKKLIDCPDLFPLPVDGDKSNMRWILLGGSGYYYVGDFDGREFKPESGEIKYSYGDCFYASQTFNDVPEKDGRRIQITWGTIDTPGMPFNQIMLFPVVLTLHSTDEGPRMFANPIDEIKNIYSKEYKWDNMLLKPGQNPLCEVKGELFDIDAEFEASGKGTFGFIFNEIPVVYNKVEQKLTCSGSEAFLPPLKGKIRIRILVDKISLEIYANGGEVYMPIRAGGNNLKKNIKIFTKGENTQVSSLVIHRLKSIWK
jgi:fructan beta-fructosidase